MPLTHSNYGDVLRNTTYVHTKILRHIISALTVVSGIRECYQKEGFRIDSNRAWNLNA